MENSENFIKSTSRSVEIMEGIVITEKNYNAICGRIKKFFKHEDFMVWHCTYEGMRKSIAAKVSLGTYGSEVFNTVREYEGVQFIPNRYMF